MEKLTNLVKKAWDSVACSIGFKTPADICEMNRRIKDDGKIYPYHRPKDVSKFTHEINEQVQRNNKP